MHQITYKNTQLVNIFNFNLFSSSTQCSEDSLELSSNRIDCMYLHWKNINFTTKKERILPYSGASASRAHELRCIFNSSQSFKVDLISASITSTDQIDIFVSDWKEIQLCLIHQGFSSTCSIKITIWKKVGKSIGTYLSMDLYMLKMYFNCQKTWL